MSHDQMHRAEILRALRARDPGCPMSDEELLRASEGSVWRACFEFGLAFRKAFCVDDIEDLIMRAIALPRWVWIVMTALFVVVIFTAPHSGQ